MWPKCQGFSVSVTDDSSEWTCEIWVDMWARSSEEARPLAAIIPSEELYEIYTIAIPSEELKKAPDHCPFYHLSSEASLIGIPLWHLHLDCTLYLAPCTLIVPCTLIASQFSIPYLHLCTFTCTLGFPFAHFYTFGHSFKFSLFCNLFLLAFPLKLTFRLDCFVVEVSHLHYSVLLFFWTRFILCRSLNQPPGLEFLSRVINSCTLRHDIPV